MPKRRELPRGITRIDSHTKRRLKPGEEKGRPWMYRANVRVGKKRLWQQTYPPDKPIKEIEDERALQRAELKKAARASAALGPIDGTLANDIERYLLTRSSMPSFADRQRELRMWVPRFGKRARNSIKPEEIEAQIAEWDGKRVEIDGERVREYSPITINHWRTALGHLYTKLNRRSGYNPVRDVERLHEPDARPRAISMTLVRRILAQMETNGREFGAKAGSLSAIRARVLAFTGIRAGELMALTPADVRRSGSECCLVVDTEKKGRLREVPLEDDALKAIDDFERADAWGTFSESSLGKAVRAACARLTDDRGRPIPPIRPHDFRHSFASWLVNEGDAKLPTAQYILGHRNINTTMRYLAVEKKDARRALKLLKSVA